MLYADSTAGRHRWMFIVIGALVLLPLLALPKSVPSGLLYYADWLMLLAVAGMFAYNLRHPQGWKFTVISAGMFAWVLGNLLLWPEGVESGSDLYSILFLEWPVIALLWADTILRRRAAKSKKSTDGIGIGKRLRLIIMGSTMSVLGAILLVATGFSAGLVGVLSVGIVSLVLGLVARRVSNFA